MSNAGWPVVAGIPLHGAAPGRNVSHWLLDSWRDSEATDEPVYMRYEVGSTEPGEFRLVVDGDDSVGRYYADDANNLAVRASPSVDRPAQLLVTRRAGYEYTIRYACAAEIGELQWRWPRTILTDALPARGRGAVAHASAVRLASGAGVLCAGVSGAGKTTFARSMISDVSGVVALSDDRVAITDEADGPRLWGTPWYSAAHLATGIDAPLAAIVFPGRGGVEPRLTPLAPPEAARRLLRSLGVPVWCGERTAFVLEFASRLVASAPAFEMAYTPVDGVGCRVHTLLEDCAGRVAHVV